MEFSSHRVAQLSNGGDGVAVVSSNGGMFELSKHRMVECLNWWSWCSCQGIESLNDGVVKWLDDGMLELSERRIVKW